MFSFITHSLGKLIRRLFILVVMFSLLVLAAIYFAGYLPIQYATNLFDVNIPPNLTVNGTLADGTAIVTDNRLTEPQTFHWQRHGLRSWQVETSSQLTQGSFQVQPAWEALHVNHVNIQGEITPILLAQLGVANNAVNFSYATQSLAVDIDWRRSWARVNTGQLSIRDLMINETGNWARLGDYRVLFNADDWRTIAQVQSDTTNGFVINGQATLTPPRAHAAATAELEFTGHFFSPDKTLRFPWFIPVTGKKTADGYPIQSTLPILLPAP